VQDGLMIVPVCPWLMSDRTGGDMYGNADLIILSDFSHEITESFINVDPLFCRRFDKLASKVFG
jgi:hypothetical protein